MFGTKTTLHITNRTPHLQWSMVVAASGFRAVLLFSLSRWRISSKNQYWLNPARKLKMKRMFHLSAWQWRKACIQINKTMASLEKDRGFGAQSPNLNLRDDLKSAVHRGFHCNLTLHVARTVVCLSAGEGKTTGHPCLKQADGQQKFTEQTALCKLSRKKSAEL